MKSLGNLEVREMDKWIYDWSDFGNYIPEFICDFEGYIIKVTPQDTDANIGVHIDFFTEE